MITYYFRTVKDQSLQTLLKGTNQQASMNSAHANRAKDKNNQAETLTLEQIFFNHHQEPAPTSSKTPIQTPNQPVNNY
jgi:hypothetical protein